MTAVPTVTFVIIVVSWLLARALLPLLAAGMDLVVKGLTRLFERRGWPSTHIPAAIIIALGFAATVWAGEGFIDLAERIRGQHSVLDRIDRTAADLVFRYREPLVTDFFRFVTTVGRRVTLSVLTLLFAALLYLRRRRWLAGFVVVAPLLGAVVNVLLKAYFTRARPPSAGAVIFASGYAFPSRHAMGSVVTFGVLAYAFSRLTPSWNIRATLAASAITGALLVGFSRVYLGVHWLSDIAGGWAVGCVWLFATATACHAISISRKSRTLVR